jgi:hypothetical protein
MNNDALHDASLESLSLHWGSGALELRLTTASGPCSIRAFDVTRLTVPRGHPWGPSVSVNEVRGPRTVGERALLEVEMQSGDVLEVEALRFVTESSNAP